MSKTAKAIADVVWEIGRNFGGGREDDRHVRRKLRDLEAVRNKAAAEAAPPTIPTPTHS